MDLSPEDDDVEICDVCEMPIEDCICEEFDDDGDGPEDENNPFR